MNTTIKRSAIALTLVIGIAAAVAILWQRPPPPQIIDLPNGEKYQFAGVTYSTRPVPPTFAAHLVNWLPVKWANLVRNRYANRLSQMNLGQKFSEPQLFIWYRRLGTNAATARSGQGFMLTAVLADQSGVKAGVSVYPNFSSSVAWSFVSFPVVRRRSRGLQCQFYRSGFGIAALSPYRTINFANPLYGRFPQWQPEPVPAVKLAGDLEVRLDALTTGYPEGGAPIPRPNGSRRLGYTTIGGGEPIQTGIDFSVRSMRGTNETWIPHRAVLSDATGNVLEATPSVLGRPLGDWNYKGLPGYSEFFRGTLWPDEAAWRVRLELKRNAGFASNELVTFKNVPVPTMGSSNAAPIAMVVGGIQIVLTEFARTPNTRLHAFVLGGKAAQIRVELPARPSGVALDFLEMITDAGPVESAGYFRSDSGYELLLWNIPTNATTADITWVVQKTRTVEFLVKPPKAE